MIKIIFSLLVILSLVVIHQCKNSIKKKNSQIDISFSTELYDHMKILVEHDFYILYWTHNKTDIIFEIHVRTNGWVGFGLSQYGSLHKSDVIIAWLNDDGTGHFSDRHVNNENLVIDEIPNWKLLHSARINNVTVFKFTRKIHFCETNDDLNIQPNGSYVVFSWGDLNKTISLKNENTKIMLLNLSNSVIKCNRPVVAHLQFDIEPTDTYLNFKEFDKNYKFYWNVTDEYLIAEIHARTTGWVCFGISPDGKIRDSDVFIGWIKDGIAFYSDRYVYGTRAINDINNDIDLLFASETNGYTIFKIKRPLILCDPDDRSIETGTPYVVYGFHNQDPNKTFEINFNQEIQSIQINFYKKNSSHLDKIENDNFFDLKLTNKIIPIRYNQFCKVYQIPKNLTKKHIYKWDIQLPKIDPESIINIRFYECDHEYRPPLVDGQCDLNINTTHCVQSSIGWSIGSDLIVYFPDDVGYPIGGDSDYSHLILNLEFIDQEESSKLIDDLHIRFYMTDVLRKHELGSVTLGTESDPLGILIPPGLDKFPITTYCYNSCMNKKFDSITFVMASPQTHSAGIQAWTKIVRNQSEIGYLHFNKYYNYMHQNFYELNPRVTVTKDDSLITQCIFSTKNRNYLTKGGVGENEETCLYSYFYYPRVKNFKICKSLPTFNEQINVFKQLKKNDLINFIYSENDSSLSTLYEAYKSLENLNNFSDYTIQKIYSIYSSNKFYAHCDGSFNFEPHEKIQVIKKSKEMEKCVLIKERSKNLVFGASSKSTDSKRFLFNKYAIILNLFMFFLFWDLIFN